MENSAHFSSNVSGSVRPLLIVGFCFCGISPHTIFKVLISHCDYLLHQCCLAWECASPSLRELYKDTHAVPLRDSETAGLK